MYLLDTNILSHLMREPAGGRMAKRIAKAGEELVCTSIVVACELRFGAAKINSTKLTARVEQTLDALDVLPLEPPVDTYYGEIRAALERKGSLVSPNGMLIAAHALTLGLILVTDNTREFSHIEGIRIENWIA